MTSEALECASVTAYRQYARLPPHRGSGTFRLGETTYSGFAEFLLPADGQAIIAFHSALQPDIRGFRDRRRHRWQLRLRFVPHRVSTLLCPSAD